MKSLHTIILSALFATSGFGYHNMPGALSELANHARSLQKEAQTMSQQLKNKQVDKQLLEQKLATVEESVGKLRELVAAVEASNPELTPAQKQNWELVKTKVELLNIFTSYKKDLVTKDDVQKKRSLIRAHAEGIAKRAAMLEQTASRML
ncbi:MAG: hypothetical protein JNK48_35125 [Bryobacterales bacterium]|nr:hypothetical protein [Bryobacterales bacterium]